MAEHFDEMTCLLYLEGQLEPERARELGAHAKSCAACRALVAALEAEGRWLRESLDAGDESVPAHLLEPSARAAIPWGWVAAFAFGSAGAYALWSGIVEPWQQQFSEAGFTQGNILTMLFFSSALWKGWSQMRSVVEIIATLSVLGIGAMLMRHNWRRGARWAAVVGALAFALGMPAPAAATEMKHGDPNYTLHEGEKINGDLFVTADLVHIDGEVDGDLYVFSQSVTVTGHVSGDVISLVKELRISGRVDGNIRDWSEILSVEGTVGKNVLAGGSQISLDPKSEVGGSLTAFCEVLQVGGRVGRDLLIRADSIDLNGTVGGDTRVAGERIIIGPHAVLRGRATYSGDRPPQVNAGAKLASPLEVQIEKRVSEYKTGRFYWHRAFGWAAGVLFGIVLMLLSPGFFAQTVRTGDRFGAAVGFGILFLIATPIAAIIACFTLVGLAVGIATLLLYPIALYTALVVVGRWIGEKILGEGIGTGATIGRLALGLAVFTVVISIPWIGLFAKGVAYVWGLGAIVLAVHKRTRPVEQTA